jgi:hypothetical protein
LARQTLPGWQVLLLGLSSAQSLLPGRTRNAGALRGWPKDDWGRQCVNSLPGANMGTLSLAVPLRVAALPRARLFPPSEQSAGPLLPVCQGDWEQWRSSVKPKPEWNSR